MEERVLEIFSDFGQIIVSDEDWEGDDGPTDWSAKDMQQFACSGTYVVGLKVIENDNHKIPLRIHEAEPEISSEGWDHVVDVPVEFPSGVVDFGGEELELAAGKYVVRWSIQQKSPSDGDYQIDLWKGSAAQR